MKALVTGINGFAGSYLAEALLQSGAEVSGVVEPGTSIDYIKQIAGKIRIFEADIVDRTIIEKVFKQAAPSHLFHLAGLSSVKDSFDRPQDYFRVNLSGGDVVLTAAAAMKNIRVLVVTSGDIYGDSLMSGELVNEKSPIRPRSPYAVSKAALDMLASVFFVQKGLEVVIARPFSHIGPRQSAKFFVPTVARQIAEIIKQEKKPEIQLGETDIYRDFTDVRDIARAYILLAEKGQTGESYNICSGRRYHLQAIVSELVKMADIKINITTDPSRFRKADITDMHLDNRKIKEAVDWEPKIQLTETLRETLAYWLQQPVKKG